MDVEKQNFVEENNIDNNIDNNSVNDNSNESDREDYRKLKKEVKNKKEHKKKNIGETLGKLLKKKIKKDPILIKHQSVFKKIDEETKQMKELREKKKMKLMQKKLGYRLPEEWDKKYEKNLLKITTKGVVKLFNSIYEFRKKIRDEKEKEGRNIN
jgi:hypothetical protein